MPKPRVLVLRAPGTNCDVETAFAFQMAGAEAVSIHVQQLIERPILADSFQILCFPGGFSYGDDIAAGRVLATQLNVHLRDAIESFRSEDRLVLGICNGFQVMMRLGIFFNDTTSTPPATLTWNQQGRFEDRWVHLKVCNPSSPFLNGIDQIFLPMAHAEGRFVVRDENAKKRLIDQQQIAIRYCDANGLTSDEVLDFPINPNGAALNLAGLCDESGHVFGLMPHPERHLFATHHPFWTRREVQPEHGEGLAIFKNAVAFFN
ncbi:MAG: phosphoribosylformylglycinamidine synthase I [Pirellulaceae bacterium]|nr:phosphoribosylformylglycinamidine synthase I [Pirellulaceae bacterium]